MQQDLFGMDNGKPKPKNELAIVKKGKQVLTKEQKEFNRLVKKIEKLRIDLNTVGIALNKQIEYYTAHIHPIEQRIVPLRTACIKIFFPFYTGEKKFLTKKEKNTLREIIESDLDEVFSLSPGEPEAELKAVYKAISGESYEDTKREVFNDMKDEMEARFKADGFDINLDDFNDQMSEEEILQKMKMMQEEMERQASEKTEKNAGRKKTKKQAEREEKEKQLEDARKKSIGSVYKQLVKAFHPDLETDDAIKLQKEEIMKQLTVAYENNDLHTLLKLEMEWIQKESNDPGKLNNNQLAIYNEALREQVMDLEMQIGMLEDHPRYMPLRRYANAFSALHTINLKREERELGEIASSLEEIVADLNGKNALKCIKDIIASYAQDIDPTENVDALLKELVKAMR